MTLPKPVAWLPQCARTHLTGGSKSNTASGIQCHETDWPVYDADQMRAYAQQCVTVAVAEVRAVPAGYWLAPVEPDMEMLMAGSDAASGFGTPLTRTANAYRAMRLVASPPPPGAESAWKTYPGDGFPQRHARHLVRRDGVLFTATPCYGMHAPWWVVKTMDGEATPVDMEFGDQWIPASSEGAPA